MWFSTVTNWSFSFTCLNIDVRKTNNYVIDLELFQDLLTVTIGKPDFIVASHAYCLKPRNAKKLGTEKVWNFWRCLLVQVCFDDLQHAEDVWNSKPRIAQAPTLEILEQIGELTGCDVRITQLGNKYRTEVIAKAKKSWEGWI